MHSGMRKEAIINSILMILRTVITPGQEGKQKSKVGIYLQVNLIVADRRHIFRRYKVRVK